MEQFRVTLPTLARSQLTTTCIDTNNVSRNPNFVPPSKFSSHMMSSEGFNIRRSNFFQPTVQKQPRQTTPMLSFQQFPSFQCKNTVGTSFGNKPSSPWQSPSPPLSHPKPQQDECASPSKPQQLTQSERIEIWNKITPEEQESLVCGEITIYEIKAKYDALKQNPQEVVTLVDPVVCSEEPITEIIKDTSVDEPVAQELEPTVESTSQQTEYADTNSCDVVTTPLLSGDVSICSDQGFEDEFESTTPNFVVSDRPQGSGQSIIQHELGDIAHYHHSSIKRVYEEDELIAISVLYNFKKRRRKQVC